MFLRAHLLEHIRAQADALSLAMPIIACASVDLPLRIFEVDAQRLFVWTLQIYGRSLRLKRRLAPDV